MAIGVGTAAAGDGRAARRSSRGGGSVLHWQFLLGAALLGVWEMTGRGELGQWTSRPSLVVVELLRLWEGDLYTHVLTTAAEMLIGLTLGSLAGIVAGLVLGRIPVLALTFRPLILALYSVPLIALAPLLIMFFGLGMTPKVVLITVVVFFLVFFNTMAGAESVDQDLVESLDLMGSTRREQFQKVIAPACMVWIIAGIKTALPYSLVAAVTGEMLAAQRGLGFLLSQAASQFDMTELYAVLLILMVMGLLVGEAAARLERWLLRWRQATA